ncbi:hypothetical protein WMY93_003949 [Mugilogobius chulae]|uniref:ZP domain-containing protein n=1 Tax=Mugilogobius chulae TaxID=88201 RepID=A0AAW0PPX5_9GOBI
MPSLDHLKDSWQKDLGINISTSQWTKAQDNVHSSSICARHGLIRDLGLGYVLRQVRSGPVTPWILHSPSTTRQQPLTGAHGNGPYSPWYEIPINTRPANHEWTLIKTGTHRTSRRMDGTGVTPPKRTHINLEGSFTWATPPTSDVTHGSVRKQRSETLASSGLVNPAKHGCNLPVWHRKMRQASMFTMAWCAAPFDYDVALILVFDRVVVVLSWRQCRLPGPPSTCLLFSLDGLGSAAEAKRRASECIHSHIPVTLLLPLLSCSCSIAALVLLSITAQLNTQPDKVYACFEGYKDPATSNTCVFAEVTGTLTIEIATQEATQQVFKFKDNSGKELTFTLQNNKILILQNSRITWQVHLEIGPDGTISRERHLPENDLTELSFSGCRTSSDVGFTNVACEGLELKSCSSSSPYTLQTCTLACVNGACADHVCAVTSTHVIDVNNNMHTIPDRCNYKLLDDGTRTITAAFRDRRRQDVGLLDHVVIKENSGSHTYELFRGQEKYNGDVVDISNFNSFSKTATAILIDYTSFDMSFDGDSAVITLGSKVGMSGLCIDGQADANRDTTNLDGCDSAVQVDAETKDCTELKTLCEVMQGAFFGSCNTPFPPEKYIAACKDTVCKYPSADTMSCSYHQAYATACAMINHPPDDYRTSAKCASAPGACLDTYCSSHEFCGLQQSTETCLCRSSFAAKYTGNKLGEPTTCDSSSASLSLAVCLLDQKGIHYDELQLNDATCKGQKDPDTHMLNFKFDSTNKCGTETENKNNQLIYKNKVTLKDHTTGVITRHDQFQVDFSCYYSQPEVKNVALKIKSSSVVDTIVSGEWTYTLTMSAYLNKERTTAIGENEQLLLDTPIWVELSATGLDENLVSIVTTSCWATQVANKDDATQYKLIETPGCANAQDSSVKVTGNGLGPPCTSPLTCSSSRARPRTLFTCTVRCPCATRPPPVLRVAVEAGVVGPPGSTGPCLKTQIQASSPCPGPSRSRQKQRDAPSQKTFVKTPLNPPQLSLYSDFPFPPIYNQLFLKPCTYRAPAAAITAATRPLNRINLDVNNIA